MADGLMDWMQSSIALAPTLMASSLSPSASGVKLPFVVNNQSLGLCPSFPILIIRDDHLLSLRTDGFQGRSGSSPWPDQNVTGPHVPESSISALKTFPSEFGRRPAPSLLCGAVALMGVSALCRQSSSVSRTWVK